MENVTSKFIKINGINDVTEFVQMAGKVEGDIEVRRGRWCIDAKSVMGMFSIDTSAGITVVYPATATDFAKYISKFEG